MTDENLGGVEGSSKSYTAERTTITATHENLGMDLPRKTILLAFLRRVHISSKTYVAERTTIPETDKNLWTY